MIGEKSIIEKKERKHNPININRKHSKRKDISSSELKKCNNLVIKDSGYVCKTNVINRKRLLLKSC